MARVAIYCRVSTEDQADNGTSLQSQLQYNRAFCHQHNLTIVMEIEDSVSGYETIRPGLNALIEASREKRIDAVVVYDVDRFARGVEPFYGILPMIKRNVRIIYLVRGSEEIDLRNVSITHILKLWQGGIERENIRERTMRGTRQAIDVDHRVFIRGSGTFGYRSVGGKKRDTAIDHSIISDIPGLETAPKVVAWIYNQYAYQGVGATEIARTLNDYGFKTAKNIRWSDIGIRRLIRNPMYCGNIIRFATERVDYEEIRYNDKSERLRRQITKPESEWTQFDRPDLAIVSVETWEKAKKRAENGRGKVSGFCYVMRNRLSCVHGRKYTGSGMPDSYRYYKLSIGVFIPRCECKSYVNIDTIDSAVWEWVCSLLNDTERVLTAYRDLQSEFEHENAENITRVKDFDSAISEAESELAYLIEEAREYRDNKRLRDHYRELIKNQNAKIDAMTRERNNLALPLEDAMITDEQIAATVDYFKQLTVDTDALEAMSNEDKRRILEILDLQVVLSPDHSTLTIHWAGSEHLVCMNIMQRERSFTLKPMTWVISLSNAA